MEALMATTLLTDEQRAQLLANGVRTDRGEDHDQRSTIAAAAE